MSRVIISKMSKKLADRKGNSYSAFVYRTEVACEMIIDRAMDGTVCPEVIEYRMLSSMRREIERKMERLG